MKENVSGCFFLNTVYVWFVCVLFVPSVLWYCWLGRLTCKNRLPYNLYCVGGDVKHCSIQSNVDIFVVISIGLTGVRWCSVFADTDVGHYWTSDTRWLCRLFAEILSKEVNSTEIQFTEDGNWRAVRPDGDEYFITDSPSATTTTDNTLPDSESAAAGKSFFVCSGFSFSSATLSLARQ